MTPLISVEGIECYAYHGCLPEEALTGNRFTVDVYVYADVSKSLLTDKLEDTVDYVLINKVVIAEMALRSNLIEHVAGRILNKLSEQVKNYVRMEVRVNKFNPPVNGNIRQTSVLIGLEGKKT